MRRGASTRHPAQKSAECKRCSTAGSRPGRPGKQPGRLVSCSGWLLHCCRSSPNCATAAAPAAVQLLLYARRILAAGSWHRWAVQVLLFWACQLQSPAAGRRCTPQHCCCMPHFRLHTCSRLPELPTASGMACCNGAPIAVVDGTPFLQLPKAAAVSRLGAAIPAPTAFARCVATPQRCCLP